MNCYRLCKGIGTVSKAHSVIHRAAAAAGAGGGGRDGGGGRGDGGIGGRQKMQAEKMPSPPPSPEPRGEVGKYVTGRHHGMPKPSCTGVGKRYFSHRSDGSNLNWFGEPHSVP